MKYLPYGGFEWETNEIEIKNVLKYIEELNSNGKGCFFEVDLEYPEDLHDLHNDFPFCPESIKIDKCVKLVCNLLDKEKYIIHQKAIEQVLNHRIKIKKINRILTFNQSQWLKPYIELNTNLRTKSTNDFEKDFFKLMNNSVFGKTMENVRNRCDVK